MPASSRIASQLPNLAIIPALLLLAGTVAWHLQQMRQRQVESEPPPQSAAATPSPTATAPDLTVIGEWEPYGSANENATPVAAPVVASALNIQLRGTLAPQTGEGKGSAIIADESGSEKTYRIGDTVAADATLAEVKPHEIVIKRADQLESVALPKAPSEGGGEGAPLPEVTNLPQAAIPTPPPNVPATVPAKAPGTESAPAAPAAPTPAMSPAPQAAVPEALPPGNN